MTAQEGLRQHSNVFHSIFSPFLRFISVQFHLSDMDISMLIIILVGSSLVLTIALILIISYFSDRIILRWYKATRLENLHIKRIVSKVSDKAGLPEPRMYLAPSNIPN